VEFHRDRALRKKLRSDFTLKIDSGFYGLVFNCDHDYDEIVRIAIRFKKENQDPIEMKKTRSDRKKFNRFVCTSLACLRRRAGPASVFQSRSDFKNKIGIRFSYENRGSIVSEKRDPIRK